MTAAQERVFNRISRDYRAWLDTEACGAVGDEIGSGFMGGGRDALGRVLDILREMGLIETVRHVDAERSACATRVLVRLTQAGRAAAVARGHRDRTAVAAAAWRRRAAWSAS